MVAQEVGDVMDPQATRDDSEDSDTPLAPSEDLVRAQGVVSSLLRRNFHDRNPTGKNQFQNCPSKNDIRFQNLLREYHKITTNRQTVVLLLKKEHHIDISERTITRRWKEMGLKGSKATEDVLAPDSIINLVAEQMALDPSGRSGQNTVKKMIALRTGVHLKRETVGSIQKILDPVGVASRSPNARRIQRKPLTSDGPNDVWCCDGHDKLVKYGFAIWGMRDKFSRKWLGLWVMPNNRIAMVVAYLWLTVVRELKGLSRQSSTDCGTENNVLAGLAHALKDAFASQDVQNKPGHIFLRSVHHIPIERGWLDLRNDFGHNIPYFWEAGEGIYDASKQTHRYLVKWLWPPLIQKELDKFRNLANNRRVRKQKDKVLPSGTTPNFAYSFPERFGGRECLQEVDVGVVDAILADMEGEHQLLTDWGVPAEFIHQAEDGIRRLGIVLDEVNLTNVWTVFTALQSLIP